MEKEPVEVLLEEVRGQLPLLAEGHMALLARFDGVDRRFDGVDARLDRVETRLDTMDRRFERLELEERRIGDGFANHERRITRLEKRRPAKAKAKKSDG